MARPRKEKKPEQQDENLSTPEGPVTAVVSWRLQSTARTEIFKAGVMVREGITYHDVDGFMTSLSSALPIVTETASKYSCDYGSRTLLEFEIYLRAEASLVPVVTMNGTSQNVPDGWEREDGSLLKPIPIAEGIIWRSRKSPEENAKIAAQFEGIAVKVPHPAVPEKNGPTPRM